LKCPTLETVSVATYKDLIKYLAKNFRDIIWHKLENGEDLRFDTERHMEEHPTELGSSNLQAAKVTPIVQAAPSIKELTTTTVR